MRENRSSGFTTRFDTNLPVQSEKKVRSLKFWLQVEEELYYPYSENKGADQLRSTVTAKLICAFVFALAKVRSSHDAAHIAAHMSNGFFKLILF